MAKWVKLTGLDGKTPVILNLAAAVLITPNGEGARITFAGGPDSYADVRERPEQVLQAPQVGW